MDEVYTLLREPLNTENGNVLAGQLSEIEAWAAYVSNEARKAVRELSEARRQYLMPKEKGVTEMDREVDLSGRTADLQEAADRLRDYADIIAKRISLGQTLLKSMRAEAEHGLR